jgi:hypothetical protein
LPTSFLGAETLLKFKNCFRIILHTPILYIVWGRVKCIAQYKLYEYY